MRLDSHHTHAHTHIPLFELSKTTQEISGMSGISGYKMFLGAGEMNKVRCACTHLVWKITARR